MEPCGIPNRDTRAIQKLIDCQQKDDQRIGKLVIKNIPLLTIQM